MTSATLSWGCGFLAFGPTLSLLFLICYQKAQLIIVVTTSAFAFLLSALLASLLWLPFDAGNLDNALFALVPGVLAQFLMRCGFVWLYHKVEQVIQSSIERHEQQHPEEQQEGFRETARLRLVLNDVSCGIAAGCGFGGMHALLLYGTLLASESSNVGTLYQDSCPGLPSLVLSAINALLFSIMDLTWMLLTFFGMRRRLLFPASSSSQLITWNIHHFLYGGWGAAVGNSRRGGNLALVLVALSHLSAAFATTSNELANGCLVSLPMLSVVVVFVVLFFWGGVSKVYIPAQQHAQRRNSSQELLGGNSNHED